MFDSASVKTWQQRLSVALREPTGLDDAERVDTLRALEQLVCTATAAQATLADELDRSQRAEQVAQGVPAAQQGRGVAAQVALARRESPHRGQRHLGLAKVVAAELPQTRAAWQAGRITEWKATLIARETGCLSVEDRLAVDAAVAGDPERLERMGDRELATACQQVAYALDPESYVTRRRKAEQDRNVSLRPAPDAMAWLTALVPVKDGVAVKAALTRTADSARAAGDPRTRGQVEADTLVESVLAAAAQRDVDVTRWDQPSDATTAGTTRPGVGLSLGLTMSDTALFGGSDEPAYAEGYGPIPAELAREWVSGACSAGETVWLRRLYTSPTTGQLVAMDSRGRLFPHGLGRFIVLRDQVCRTPWCDAPIRHTDHALAHVDDGPTDAENGQGLCEACNHAKQAPGWRARPSPDPSVEGDGHHITTTTPTGHAYRSSPPVLATIRETSIRIEYVLAG